MLLSLSIGWGNSFGLNVNNDDVEVRATTQLKNLLGTQNSRVKYFLLADYLHTDSDSLFTAGFGATSILQGDASGLSASLGFASVFGKNYVTLPLFVEGTLRLPLDSDLPPSFFMTRLEYAPKALSFDNAESYLSLRFESSVEVIPNISLYMGYRHIDTDYISHEENFNSSWYGGLKIGF